MWKIQSIDFLPPDKVEELILCGTSISVCFKKSLFFIWFFFDFMWKFLKTFFMKPNGFSWNLGFFTWNQFLWKGLFYLILICQLVLPFFPGNLGIFIKQSSFSYFSYETFFEEECRHHAGEGMSLYLCVGKQQ